MRTRLLLPVALLLLAIPSHAQEEEPRHEPSSEEEPRHEPLSIRIESPVSGWTRERIVTVSGTVSGEDAEDRVTLVTNGVGQEVSLRGGLFVSEQVLAPGENVFVAMTRSPSGVASDTVSLYARVPRKDVRITLTWDTDGSDVDLRLTGPSGETCSYQNARADFGAVLDMDVTDGYGPETITLARAPRGSYRVQVQYYGDRGGGPALCRAVLVRGEGTVGERRDWRTILLREEGEEREVMSFVMGEK